MPGNARSPAPRNGYPTLDPTATKPPVAGAVTVRSQLPWKAPQVGGIAVSANGIDFTDYAMVQNTSDTRRNRWRFDAQARQECF